MRPLLRLPRALPRLPPRRFTSTHPSLPDFEATLTRTLSGPPPAEPTVLHHLRTLHTFLPSHPPAPPARAPSIATSAARTLLTPLHPPAVPSPSTITDLAYTLISHPSVFLTPAVLRTYLALTRAVRDPASIPAALHLYAHKPAPGSTRAAPAAARNAVPEDIAEEALRQALQHGGMRDALDVVDLTFGAAAYRRRMLVTRGVPAVGVGVVTPAALWGVAGVLARWQDTVPVGVAEGYAFAGLCAYAGFTVTLGLVAVATGNDQMVRVTWVPGTPLRERWLRERERAALDEVAQWWGFAEEKRGEEEGAEWELLREVVGRKGMVLDETSLMKGME